MILFRLSERNIFGKTRQLASKVPHHKVPKYVLDHASIMSHIVRPNRGLCDINFGMGDLGGGTIGSVVWSFFSDVAPFWGGERGTRASFHGRRHLRYVDRLRYLR